MVGVGSVRGGASVAVLSMGKLCSIGLGLKVGVIVIIVCSGLFCANTLAGCSWDGGYAIGICTGLWVTCGSVGVTSCVVLGFGDMVCGIGSYMGAFGAGNVLCFHLRRDSFPVNDH